MNNQNALPLVVLGAYDEQIQKKRTLATIEYLRAHPLVSTIIFSGGHTHGKQNPSEAESMKNIFEKYITKDEDFKQRILQIITENDSYDTEENAENVIAILQNNFGEKIQKILLLSDTTHILRAGWSFQRRGVQVERISSEKWFVKRSSKHLLLLGKNFFKTQTLKNFGLEILAHGLSLSEKGRKKMKGFSRKRRENNT